MSMGSEMGPIMEEERRRQQESCENELPEPALTMKTRTKITIGVIIFAIAVILILGVI